MKSLALSLLIMIGMTTTAEATQRFRSRLFSRQPRVQRVVVRQPVVVPRQQIIVTQPLLAPQIQLRQFHAVPLRQQIIVY